jgi:hypothetical protein
MWVKSVSIALVLLLISATMASASLVSLTFPVIKPVYSSNSDDMSSMLGWIGDIVKFSKAAITSGGNMSPDDAFVSPKLSSMPAPDVLMAAMAPPMKPDTMAKNNIYATLAGTNLTYYSIAGKPMNYTITRDSIKSIDKTAYKGDLAWKVRVGEGMAWNIFMDATGKNILKTDQLFQT